MPPIIGESAAIKRAVELVKRFAPTSMPILLVGPTGTGKDLLARHIHARSGRAGRFVGVNCAALPHGMAEGLLFGHRRGAFSGAVESRRGYLEQADRGTLLLDELACLAPGGQAKLLRALEGGEIQPLGEERTRMLDFRIVAAAQGAMSIRPDLYHRIAGVVIELPPLADRPEDVVALTRHFAEQQQQRLESGWEREVVSYAWPGNVRELMQVLARAGHLVSNGTLPRSVLADSIRASAMHCDPAATSATPDRRSELERLLVLGGQLTWNPRRMASALGLGRSGLYARLKRLGVSLRDLRASTQSTLSSGRPVDRVDGGRLANG